MLGRLALLVSVVAISACAGPEHLTADAVNCATRDVNIVPSAYSRKGMQTAWCATCKDKLYRCATNAARTHTVCVQSREGDGCQ